jgi:membrane protein DedA with SNARE-associated domain
MGLIEQTSFLSGFFGEFGYLAPFVVLLLCGVGLPLPEEVTLIGSGLLYYRGEVEFVPIVIVCSAAILLGDSIPFWLGRRYGMNALRIPWVARIVHPERFAKLRARFEEHGNWATFACRFFAGIRIPGYFLAGTMEMRYTRFLLLDLLGVLISVPISIYLGKVFGGSMDTLKARVHDIHLILAFLALSLILILFLRHRRNRARVGAATARAAAEEEQRIAAEEAPRADPEA